MPPSFALNRCAYRAPWDAAEVTTGSGAPCDARTTRLPRGANGTRGSTVIRNRTGEVLGTASGRTQRVHRHPAFKTLAIEPEHDRLGRQAPNVLSPMRREGPALEQCAQQENRAGAQPVFFGASQLTVGGQTKQQGERVARRTPGAYLAAILSSTSMILPCSKK
jgi:hypothetical protein